MDWKTFAIDKLKQYEAKRQALTTIPMQLAEIEATMTGIRSAGIDGTPVKGSGGNKREDMLLNCIVQKADLEQNLRSAQMWVDIVNRGLSILERDERKVLERLYVVCERGAVKNLAEEFGLWDERSVYKRRDTALHKFTVALYGCTES